MRNPVKLLSLKAFALAGLALSLVACETVPSPGQRDEAPAVVDEDPVGLEEPATLPNLDEDRVVRVALLLPFSAQSENIQSLADGMLKAAQMVAFESGNESFLLIPEDTRGTPQGARDAAEAAVRGGADIILGPLLSESVQAVAPVARGRNIPVVAFSTDREVAGNGVYLLSFPPEPEIERVTSYALSQGYARFGLLAPITRYGDRVTNAFEEEIYDGGGTLVQSERYIRNVDDMRGPANRLAEYAAPGFIPQYVTPRTEGAGRRSDRYGPLPGLEGLEEQENDESYPQGYDKYGPKAGAQVEGPLNRADVPVENYDPASDGFQAVLLPESGRMLRALAPLLPYNDVDIREIKLLGVSSWSNPALHAEPALSGGWFAAPDPERSEGFERRYRVAYGNDPVRLASLAYDATLIAARLAESNAANPYSKAMLTNPAGFIGADGLFRLTEEGMVERGLAVLEISRSGVKVIDPAPLSFRDPMPSNRF